MAVVSPELQRGGVKVKSRYNAAALARARHRAAVPGHPHDRPRARPQLQLAPTSEQVHRVAIIGADVAEQLFGNRDGLGEAVTLNGIRYTVVGKIRKKDQDSNYSGPDNDKIFVPFAAMAQRLPAHRRAARRACRNIIVAPKPWVVDELPRVLDARTGRIEDIDWPLEQRRPRDARAPARLRSRRPRRHRDVGHLAPDADVRPHDRHDARLLHASSASSRWRSAASA